MTTYAWNAEDAVVARDEETGRDEAAVWRYGVTGWEASHPEPLDRALAQELPDNVDDLVEDEMWVLVDDTEEFPGRLVADEKVRDDDYALVVDDEDGFAPEELAMHLMSP